MAVPAGSHGGDGQVGKSCSEDLLGGWDSCHRPEGGTADTAIERFREGKWGKSYNKETL